MHERLSIANACPIRLDKVIGAIKAYAPVGLRCGIIPSSTRENSGFILPTPPSRIFLSLAIFVMPPFPSPSARMNPPESEDDRRDSYDVEIPIPGTFPVSVP